ncbi:hypothetical protein [Woodsholea maritima]|uniref:hypothetical protein n=1 Tax=Woodsholea maritima TaxID=240237 RepID=UPI00036168E3|nr:hypothetical protein [Woodsholea maritima]
MTNTLFAIILLGCLGLAMGLILARKAPFQWLGRLFKLITFPIRYCLRLIGIIPKAGRRQMGDLGPSALAVTERAFREDTDLEKALGPQADYEHERSFISQYGFLFRWVNIRVGFMRVPEELSDEVAEAYNRQGQAFMTHKVDITANPSSLYEDAEAAVIVDMFKEADSGVFFLINEMRKMMNANVRKLTVWFSAILSATLVINIMYNDGHSLDIYGALQGVEALPISQHAFNSVIFALASTLLAALIMWILFFVEYSPYQRSNARELSNFLTRYLARLNDHYRTAAGKAKSVTVGQERDVHVIARNAQLWHTNIIWIGMRVFFIESFVRNGIYQIRRNSSYYLLLVPLAFLCMVFGASGLLSSFTDFDLTTRLVDLGWVFALLFILLIVIYGLFLKNSMSCMEEIDQGEWISYHSMQLNAVLGEVVGKYAEDVGYWKNRVGGGM